MSTNATQGSAAQAQGVQRPRTQAILPAPVDISESSEEVTVLADMPGVSRERLQVRVEGNRLLLAGTVQLEPEHAQAVPTYRRHFVLSRELETDKIEARLKDGVLTVRIPKRAELRPRKVEVQAG